MSERQQVLSAAIDFINDEADLLDRGAFHLWLALWHPEGLYVVPIDLATDITRWQMSATSWCRRGTVF